jgi:hypothetical protein
MDPMEVFKIEVTGQEDFGKKKYRELILDILQDLGLIRSIGRLYVYIDIMEPVFAVFGLLRSGIPPLTVKDVGDVMKEGGYQIKINDEEHNGRPSQGLVDRYGRKSGTASARRRVIASDTDPQAHGSGPGGGVPARPDRCLIRWLQKVFVTGATK